MRKVIIVSNDENWCNQVRLRAATHAAELQFLTDLSSSDFLIAFNPKDLIVIDTRVLPTAESPEINVINRLLEGKNVIAVYTPSPGSELAEIRKSFIAGATDLVEKPFSQNGISRLVSRDIGSHPKRGRGAWLPTAPLP